MLFLENLDYDVYSQIPHELPNMFEYLKKNKVFPEPEVLEKLSSNDFSPQQSVSTSIYVEP